MSKILDKSYLWAPASSQRNLNLIAPKDREMFDEMYGYVKLHNMARMMSLWASGSSFSPNVNSIRTL